MSSSTFEIICVCNGEGVVVHYSNDFRNGRQRGRGRLGMVTLNGPAIRYDAGLLTLPQTRGFSPPPPL